MNRPRNPGRRPANKSGLAPAPQAPAGLSDSLIRIYESWPERFRGKVTISAGCWVWTASKTKNGYGRYSAGERSAGWRVAHRWAYESVHGPVADGLVLDHLCRNPACVRPDHVEPVTQADNVRRGAAGNDGSGRCRTGRHPWTNDNIVLESNGTRRCRPCRDEREQAYRPPKGTAQRDRTHCPKGHAYDEENTYVRANGNRGCRACNREDARRRYWERRTP